MASSHNISYVTALLLCLLNFTVADQCSFEKELDMWVTPTSYRHCSLPMSLNDSLMSVLDLKFSINIDDDDQKSSDEVLDHSVSVSSF